MRAIHLSTASLATLFLAACGQPAATEEAAAEGAPDTAPQATQTEMTAAPEAPALCEGFGPQTPRDITSLVGLNTVELPLAPEPEEMNLCNIHTHTNAEHSGPGFSVFVGEGVNGGYACNETDTLS